MIAYAVSQRTHELGSPWVALGATGARIASMVVGRARTDAAALCGVVAALFVTRVLQSPSSRSAGPKLTFFVVLVLPRRRRGAGQLRSRRGRRASTRHRERGE